MDLLAFYLDTGFNLGKKEFEDKWYFNLVLKSKELDPYIINNASGIESKKPQMNLTKWWKDILDFIDKRKPEKWLETSYVLLNLNNEEQVEFENLFKSQIQNIKDRKTTYKHNWIIFSSADPQRRFVVIGYPYLNTKINEQNLMMQDMIFDEDKNELNKRGACNCSQSGKKSLPVQCYCKQNFLLNFSNQSFYKQKTFSKAQIKRNYCLFSFSSSIIFCNSFSLGKLIKYFDTNTCCGKPIVAYFTNASFLPEHKIIPMGSLSPLVDSLSL